MAKSQNDFKENFFLLFSHYSKLIEFLFFSAEKIDGMEQQQYCLKWSNYSSNLATAFSNLFNSETLTDVTLFCEGE